MCENRRWLISYWQQNGNGYQRMFMVVSNVPPEEWLRQRMPISNPLVILWVHEISLSASADLTKSGILKEDFYYDFMDL